MYALIDLIAINLSAVLAFLFRQTFGDFIIKQAPSLYLFKYLQVLLLLNITYPLIFWILGLYDRRQKRALLEEFILIFGVFSTSIAVLIVFLFLGRLWWMSRIVLFLFYAFSVCLLCFLRVFGRKFKQPIILRMDLPEMLSDLKAKKTILEGEIADRLSIVIVAFNSKEKISTCLSSLKVADSKCVSEVIVVDNNSSDGTVELIKSNYPEVKLIQNKVNFGYAKAVNIGLRTASSPFCLVLNPDAIVLPGSLEVVLDYALKHPKVGVAGCKLLNEDGSLQHSVRRFLDLRTYLYRFTPLRGLMTGSQIERYYLMQDWDHRDSRLVDWILGGCMLIRMETAKKIGYMDEKFFLYFEDVDYCFRMWEEGWQVAYVAEAAMLHKHMRTSANKLFDRATREHLKSLFYFLRKHGFCLPKNCPSNLE